MPARESLDLICSCVCVCGEVKDCCVYKNRREKKKLPGSCCCCCCARLAAFAGRQIYQVDAKLHVCLLQGDARARALSPFGCFLPPHTHTHTHPKLFFLILFFFYFIFCPSPVWDRPLPLRGRSFLVCPPICVCLGYQLEQSNKLAKRENFRGKLSIAQT